MGLYKDWPPAENYTKEFLQQAKYVWSKDSEVCQKCFKEMWGCADPCVSFLVYQDVNKPTPLKELQRKLGNCDLFDNDAKIGY